MKFICDVHISYKIAKHLQALGFESKHVNHILDKWSTHDKEICGYADSYDLVLITKDSDFRDSHFVKSTPRKLIKINLGNISNQELITILSDNIDSIKRLYKKERFIIEIDKKSVTYKSDN